MATNIGTNENRTKKTYLLTSVFGYAEKNTLLVFFFLTTQQKSSHDNHVAVSIYGKINMNLVLAIFVAFQNSLPDTLCISLNNKIHFHMFRNKCFERKYVSMLDTIISVGSFRVYVLCFNERFLLKANDKKDTDISYNGRKTAIVS